MDPEQPQTSEKPTEATPNASEEMLKFAEELQNGKQEDVDPPKPKSDDDDEDSEKDPDEASDDEEEKDPEEKDEEKKNPKPNRYQRQKAKIESLEASYKKSSAETLEAIKYANIYRNRLNQVLAKYEADLKAAAEGKLPTDVEQENWSLKAKQKESEYTAELDKQHQMEAAKREIEDSKQQMVVEYKTEALGISKKLGFVGQDAKDFARKVLKHYATELQDNDKVTMQEVAQELAAMTKQRQAAVAQRGQIDNNRTAPRTLKTGLGHAPSYDLSGDSEKDKNTMLAYLASLKG